MSITRGSQLWWSQDFLATCLLVNIHITIMVIEINYDDDGDDDDDVHWMLVWLSFQAGTCVINGYCFVADDTNPYVDCLKCIPSTSTSSWTPGYNNLSFVLLSSDWHYNIFFIHSEKECVSWYIHIHTFLFAQTTRQLNKTWKTHVVSWTERKGPLNTDNRP